MPEPAAEAPDCTPIKRLLLQLADERSVDGLLRVLVDGLAAQPYVALARIWLIRPGDICDACGMREECPDRTNCLHLVASAGRSVVEEGVEWTRLDGAFRRFPFGVRKVGHIGATGEAVEVADIANDSRWLVRPDWAKREGIIGLGGQPLAHRGEIVGVLAVFTRTPLEHELLDWLRMVADHAAAAIANARAFEEIESLKAQLQDERDYLREEVREARVFGDIVGESEALVHVIRQIDLVAATDASVLILGESGTGKELVAREIHKRSPRRDRPMIKVNCASVPRELYESEFFGHVKGAFSGATRDRAGRFELADGGTLFLDEVGEIPLGLQSKLLRVLQEGELERVGEGTTRRVDVRVVAATNRDLRDEVEAGRFREDLYYRLDVFPIEVAPLRKRREDIPLLAAHFIELTTRKLNRRPPRLSSGQARELQRYDWPGNVRELQNVIERAIIVSAPGGRLRFDLPDEAHAVPVVAGDEDVDEPEVMPDADVQRLVRANIVNALKRAGWKVYGAGGAAEILGVKPTTLAHRMKAMGIKRPEK